MRHFSLTGRCYPLFSILQIIYHTLHHYIWTADNYIKKVWAGNLWYKLKIIAVVIYMQKRIEWKGLKYSITKVCAAASMYINQLQLYFLVFILNSCDKCYRYSLSSTWCKKLKFRILFIIKKTLGSTIRLSILGTACTQITFTSFSNAISPINKKGREREKKKIKKLHEIWEDQTLDPKWRLHKWNQMKGYCIKEFPKHCLGHIMTGKYIL